MTLFQFSSVTETELVTLFQNKKNNAFLQHKCSCAKSDLLAFRFFIFWTAQYFMKVGTKARSKITSTLTTYYKLQTCFQIIVW